MKSFENLIVKYINQDASVKELEQLLRMLKSKDNIVLFRSYVKINFYSIYLMNDIDNLDIINKIKEKIELEKKKQKSRNQSLRFLKYAAIFILLIGVGYYLRFLELENINSKDVIPKKDEITITTSSGRQLIINELDEITVDKDFNLIKSSNELIYSQNNKLENLTHRINVPYGKKINIVLSDGTKVYLNSGSNLIYPISFKKNEASIEEIFIKSVKNE